VKKAPVFFCIYLVLTFADPLSSHTPDSATTAFIDSVQEFLFNDKYEKAELLCVDFILNNRQSPVGYLFQAGSLLGEMSDREEKIYSEKLRAQIDTALHLCDSLLKQAKSVDDSAFLYLWRGHAHAYRSLFESRFGSFTSAIKHGLDAKGDYKRGLKQDSTLYDLHFGLGNYHYWKSVKAGILRSIGIVSNDIDKGIAELKLAADSAKYFSEAAANSLIWVWLDQKKYDSAIVIAEKMLAKYSESRTLRWPLAMSYFENKQYKNALEIFTYLYNYYSLDSDYYYNTIECDYFIYYCYKNLRMDEKAEKVLIRVNTYRSDIPKSIQRRQLSKLNHLRRELNR
jgi:tetratricopeptide (TPR) repeat protein